MSGLVLKGLHTVIPIEDSVVDGASIRGGVVLTVRVIQHDDDGHARGKIAVLLDRLHILKASFAQGAPRCCQAKLGQCGTEGVIVGVI